MAHRAGHVHVRVGLEGSRSQMDCVTQGGRPEDYSTWEESVSVREFTDAECLSSYHVAQVPRGSEASCILGSATAWF